MLQKVSVVVPIYKVEKYLHRCIDSILNQTYPHLEIILVDDGSPDNCGQIADDYAKRDERIKVIHKQNGGLSDARNCGMQYVTGEFTIFVDSDDWLESNMIEKMISKSHEFEAEITQAAFYYAYDDHLLFDNRCGENDDPPIVIDKESLMYELVNNKRVKNFAWGKLYKTDIIRDIPFEKGVLFEDVFWAYKVMHRVNKYVILNQPMYYYFQRSDSIVSTYTPRNLDFLKGLKVRHSFIEEFYPHLVDASYQLILESSLVHYTLLLANRKKDKQGLCRREIQLYIKNNYAELKRAVGNNHNLKNQLVLFKIHPYLNILFDIASRILKKIQIIPQTRGLQRIDL